MSRRPRALIDVDGPLCDFLGPCLDIINRLGRTNHTLEQMTSWDIFESLKIDKDLEKRTYDMMKQRGWCRGLPVQPGAQEGLRMLEEVADIYVCTAPMDGETWVHERNRWLLKHFGIPKSRVIPAEAKYVCAGDVLVDDKTSTLIKWRHCHPDGLAIRWKLVTNLATEYDGVTVTDWYAVRALIEKHHVPEYRRWRHP